MKTFTAVLVLFLFLFIEIGQPAELSAASPVKRKLERVVRIPDEDEEEMYFKFPPFVHADKDGFIYAFDPNSHNFIYKISPGGKLVMQIGKQGIGPGDVWWPKELKVCGEDIILKEDYSFSIFTRGGKFKNKFRLFKPKDGFDVHDNKIYLAEAGGDTSISVYDFKGNRLGAFGKRLTVPPSLHKKASFVEGTLNSCRVFCGQKELYVYFEFLGELHTYNYDGRFLGQRVVPGADPKAIKFNRDRFYKSGFPHESIIVQAPIQDIAIRNEKLYIMANTPDVLSAIMEISLTSFQIQVEYSFPGASRTSKNDLWFSNFDVQARGNRDYFYVVVKDRRDDEVYIHVYKYK